MTPRYPILGLSLLALALGLAAPAAAATLSGKVAFVDRAGASRSADLYGKFGTHDDASERPEEGRVVVVLVPARGAAPAPDPDAEIPVMNQLGQQFRPRILVVQQGSPVRFLNSDPIFHNVFSLSSVKKFDLGRYPRGDSRVVSFDKAGVVNVFCDIHPHMNAYIVVVPTPYHAVSEPDGTYRVTGVPTGSYEIRAWAPGMANPVSVGACDLSEDKDAVWDGDLRGL
jgi:plastocyanin